MGNESPEEVFAYILTHVHDRPERSNSNSGYNDEDKQKIQDWFGGRLAAEFDYYDLIITAKIARDAPFSTLAQIPPALIVNDDAYIYMDHCLIALSRVADELWKLRVCLSKCWGCFGDHSVPGGGCWGFRCRRRLASTQLPLYKYVR